MPLILDPDFVVEVTLPTDAARPKERRPVFLCRPLTSRQAINRRRLHKASYEAYRAENEAEGDKLRLEALGLSLVDWRNFIDGNGSPIAFDLQRLPDLLTEKELFSLCELAASEVEAKEADFFRSASPSPSPAAGSAPTAEAAGVTPSKPGNATASPA